MGSQQEKKNQSTYPGLSLSRLTSGVQTRAQEKKVHRSVDSFPALNATCEKFLSPLLSLLRSYRPANPHACAVASALCRFLFVGPAMGPPRSSPLGQLEVPPPLFFSISLFSTPYSNPAPSPSAPPHSPQGRKRKRGKNREKSKSHPRVGSNGPVLKRI